MASNAAPQPRPGPPPVPAGRVWIVDDSPLERARAQALLGGTYTLTVLADGGSLLEHLSQAEALPHLVLLDWQMPGVSGLEALVYLRGRHDEVTLPILVLTASTERQDVRAALEAGANDYVTKPYDEAELLARVRTLVRVRQQAEATRAADTAREQLLGSLLGQPVFGVGLLRGDDLHVVRANPTYQQMVGGRELEGQPLLEALPELAGQGFDTRLRGVRSSGVPFVARELPVHVDRRGTGLAEQAFYDVVFQPVGGPDTASDDVLLILHDVTESVQVRKEAERLAALERERSGFEQQLIGIVSHDLRNPISAILMGAAVLLRRPDVEERQRRTVERILTSAGRANRMVHDLLDFTQARLGKGLTAQRVPGDFHAIVRQVVEESQVSNPGRAVRVTHAGEGEGAWDADRLAQLVGNLLSNALHYSPQDSAITVATRGEPGHVTLSVHNSGEPIAPDLLPRLFQPMQRGVEGVSEVRSVGLGLYIVDHVARAHGGTVEVASAAGTGTTFTVRLPRGP